MSKLKNLRPGGGLLVAVLALVLALGGTATAAKLITGAQIKNSSLTGADVKNGSIGTADLSAAAKRAAKGAGGAKGDTGAAGAKGDTGSPGAAGPKGDTGAAGTNGTNGTQGVEGAPAGFIGRINSLTTNVLQVQFGYLSGAGTAATDAADRRMVSPNLALRAKSMTVGLSSAPGVGSSRTFTLQVNGVQTPLTCQVSGAASSCTTSGPSPVIPALAEVEVRTQAGTSVPNAADAIFSITLERP